MHLFIQNLMEPGGGIFSGRYFYLAWTLTLIISITLHELAHGWMAMKCGDDTPNELGRMTGNPLVHMGPFSLIALFVFGIAWGAMPIQPGRLRGRYAEAKVAFAGPAVNLGLALICVIGFAISLAYVGELMQDGSPTANLQQFLLYAGIANTVLFIFNLFPIPPLDGSHILANFNQGYSRFIANPANQGLFLLGFMGAFVLGTAIWPMIFDAYIQVSLWLVAVLSLLM